MGLHVGYQPAARCTTGPTPGARAMMAWYLGTYAPLGGTNLGIFNCRPVRGGATTSLHGEGRAVDFGINPHGAAYGAVLAERLRLASAELGVQLIIWDRRIWSGAQPSAGWRAYGGLNPHRDHLHVELSRAAAASLTAARIAVALGTGRSPAKPTLQKGSEGDHVRVLQRGIGMTGRQVDGYFGDGTKAAVIAWQRRHGLKQDGIVGPATWKTIP